MAEQQEQLGQRVGEYCLLQQLGTRSFGMVYLAQHLHDHSPVAVKLLQLQLTSRDNLKDFLNEARTIVLRHPHIVLLLDFGLNRNDTPYLVMEYATGGTLRQRYPKGTKLPFETIDISVTQLASALQYAHDHRVIHRNVKPENVLLRADGTPLLSDFGIAKVLEQNFFVSLQTQVGTPAYMAPEQSRGKPCPASDQYPLTVMVYEWLVGHLPFQGADLEVIVQHRFDVPPLLRALHPDIPIQVEQVILQALAKTPEERFSTIQQFPLALHTALQESFSTVQPTDKRAPREFPSSSLHLPHMPSALMAAPRSSNKRLPGRTLGIMVQCLVLLLSLIGRGVWNILVQQPSLAFQYATATAKASLLATAYNTAVASRGIQFGFDAQHTLNNPYERTLSPSNVTHLRQAWMIQTGNWVRSSPAVARGVVYVGSVDGKLYTFHL